MAEDDGPGQRGPPSGGMAALVIGAIAVACCAAVPLLAALAGGVTIGVVFGVVAGLAAAALLGAWAVARFRQ